MRTWRSGDLEVRGPGGPGTWRSGDLEVRGPGGQGTWRSGDLEVRGPPGPIIAPALSYREALSKSAMFQIV